MTLSDLSHAWAEVALLISLKGLLLLGAVAGLVLALRRASAATRHALWSMALVGLLLLPFLPHLLPAWYVNGLTTLADVSVAMAPRVPAPPAGLPVSPAALPVSPAEPVIAVAPGGPIDGSAGRTAEAEPVKAVPAPPAAAPSPVVAPSSGLPAPVDWAGRLFLVWVAGVVLLGMYMVTGYLRVAALIRKAVPLRDAAWLDQAERLAARAGLTRPVRMLQTPERTVPMAAGCLRPVVLLPVEAEDWTEPQREAVLLHELAHIKRWDCLTQAAAQVACALHWFNPLAWLAASRMQAEREQACDDLVLNAGTPPSRYAEQLLDLARTMRAPAWSAPATVAMARRSQLEGRLLAILDAGRRRHTLNRGTGLVTALVVAGVALPLAAMRPGMPHMRAAPPELEAPEPEIAAAPDVDPDYDVAFDYDMAFDFEVGEPSPGTDSLTIEQLIRLRKYGVDAGFIRSLRELGYEELSVDELIDLAKYGVDAGYVRALREAGFVSLPVDVLVDMRKYDVDPAYVQAIRQAGYTNLDAEALIDLSKYGVSERLIITMRELGYTDLSADALIDLAKYGADADYVRAMRDAGYDRLPVDDLADMSKYGVSPETVAVLADLGYARPDVDDLIDLAKYGVDARYVQEMNRAGLGTLSLAELAELGKYGVDMGYVREIRDAGLTDVTADQLIELHKHGVDAAYIREMLNKN